MRCCNPECQEPFDHREGRLVRFTRKSPDARQAVQHYWLCGSCVRIFVFDFNSGTGLQIRPRDQEFPKEKISRAASAA